jgi:hypothetical protein
MLNLKEKTHSRNLREQKEKLRETQERLKFLEENCNNLQGKLRVGVFSFLSPVFFVFNRKNDF